METLQSKINLLVPAIAPEKFFNMRRNDSRINEAIYENMAELQANAEKTAREFTWEEYPRNEIVEVLNKFSQLGNHGNWFNPETSKLNDPAFITGKTNTELMVELAKAVCTVSKATPLGLTNNAWGQFEY